MAHKERLWIVALATVLLVTASIVSIVIAEDASFPEGASISVIDRERRPLVTGDSQEALAGNVTEMDLTGVTVTRVWQGFYGNVSGTITLDDADNKTLYDWVLASPEGEVFAVNETVDDWSNGNIVCFNFTTNSSTEINVTEFEISYEVENDQLDGVSETFNETDHPLFYVGSEDFSAECQTANMYVSDAAQDTQFYEVLLYDDTKDNVIFTALMEESDTTGFDSLNHDYEMVVIENGNGTDTSTTTYYFYVELE